MRKKLLRFIVPLLTAVILCLGQDVRAEDVVQSPKTVSGSVVDIDSQPIVGVMVALSGPGGAATITDAAGLFSIRASADDVLVFSMLGYQTHIGYCSGRRRWLGHIQNTCEYSCINPAG